MNPLQPPIETEFLTEKIKHLSDRDFIESFFSVINKQRVEIPFLLNRVQSELEDNWGEWNVVLKARKLGVSVLTGAKFLARILRMKNRNAVILSYDKEATQRALERTDWILNHLPFKVKPERESKNEFKIWDTNSKLLIGVAGTKAFGRGDDVTDLHVTEYAFWEDTTVMTGIMEALVPNAFVCVESTANGPTNAFAKLYRKAKKGGSKWKAHFFPWFSDPELSLPVPLGFVHTADEKQLKAKYGLSDSQLAWRRQKMADMEEPELFPQEYPANEEEAFVTLGDCVFNKKSLLNYEGIVTYPEMTGYLSYV